MSISTTYTKSSAKEYTAYEKRIQEKGDIGQGERLAGRNRNR